MLTKVFYRKSDEAEWPYEIYARLATGGGSIYLGKARKVYKGFEFEPGSKYVYLNRSRFYKTLAQMKSYLAEDFDEETFGPEVGDLHREARHKKRAEQYASKQEKRRSRRAEERARREQEWREWFERAKRASDEWRRAQEQSTARPEEAHLPDRIKRILAALREKTVANGCTEGEASAARAKIVEIWAKYKK